MLRRSFAVSLLACALAVAWPVQARELPAASLSPFDRGHAGASATPSPSQLRRALAVSRLAPRAGTSGAPHAVSPGAVRGAVSLRTPDRVAALYRARAFEPLWGSDALVLSLQAALLDARRDGLSPKRLIGSLDRDPFAAAGALGAAERDLLLSDALFVLLDRLANGDAASPATGRGLAPAADEPLAWHDLAATDIPAVAALDGPAALHALVERARPGTALYRRLHAGLSGELTRPEPHPIGPGPTLEAGSEGERVLRLRARLLPEGDLRPAPRDGAERWDASLQAAVTLFQARNGLEADGKVGRLTLARLDRSQASRIDALRVNLERARWYARALGEQDRVVVNIPDYRLAVHLDGETVWDTPVVVGSLDNRTPVLTSRMHTVVLDPTWTVPRSIVAESLFAQASADPAAFGAKGYRFRSPDGTLHAPQDIDWSGLTPARFDYWMVQGAGAGNALGSVKFLFANPYSVYLHDTPAKALFSEHRRAYSHGCVRVQDPQRLESLLLRARASIDQPTIDSLRRGQDNVKLALDEPIAVGLLYWTADVDDRGRLRLLPDVYGRDRAILDALRPSLPG